MRKRNRFPATLSAAIERHAKGGQTEIAEKAGITPATISRICNGTRDITRESLTKIARVFPEAERRRLYLAAIRDLLPDEAREMFFPDQAETPLVLREDEAEYAPLDPRTRAFLTWLEADARRSSETRAWLQTLSRWIDPENDR